MAYLCNPNNPTGRLVDPRVIDAAACRCEQVGALLVVDECFLGFAPDAPRKERGRTRRVFAPCGRALRVHQALRNGRVAVGVSDRAETPNSIEGIAVGRGRPWPVSSVAEAGGHRRPGRRRIRLAHARCIGGRASVAFPRALLARAFRRAVGCELPFSPHAGERHPRALYKQGVLVRTCDSFSVLSRFWCRVAVRTRKENARLAMAFSRALRAEGASGEGEPDERGGASCSGAMAGADGRGLAKEVDTRG